LGSDGYANGGGAIRLTVQGTIRNDGLLCADGAYNASWYSGSGGSIYLTGGSLSGIGMIRANGGGGGNGRCGGGGRISLVTTTNAGVDSALYAGPIWALGGSGGAAGTIYQQRASDRAGHGTVWVDNNGGGGYTDVPPSSNYVPGEVERATFYVTNGATLRLEADFTVGDLWLQSENAQLNLNFKTLLIHSKAHTFSGTVANYGTIIWMPDISGTVFSIR